MNTDPEYELRTLLDTNEKLVWSGYPRKGLIFRTADIFLIPFSLLWCGFASLYGCIIHISLTWST